MNGGGGSALFQRKGRGGGNPFFSKEKKIDILGNCGHFVAQNVPKYSKIAMFRRFWLIF
jgi:hypothetical protein